MCPVCTYRGERERKAKMARWIGQTDRKSAFINTTSIPFSPSLTKPFTPINVRSFRFLSLSLTFSVLSNVTMLFSLWLFLYICPQPASHSLSLYVRPYVCLCVCFSRTNIHGSLYVLISDYCLLVYDSLSFAILLRSFSTIFEACLSIWLHHSFHPSSRAERQLLLSSPFQVSPISFLSLDSPIVKLGGDDSPTPRKPQSTPSRATCALCGTTDAHTTHTFCSAAREGKKKDTLLPDRPTTGGRVNGGVVLQRPPKTIDKNFFWGEKLKKIKVISLLDWTADDRPDYVVSFHHFRSLPRSYFTTTHFLQYSWRLLRLSLSLSLPPIL